MTLPVRSTYRVQLHPGFEFASAIGILDHLQRLGISHLYTSPVLEAVGGSTHGYDVTDPTLVRAELGGQAGLEALVEELRSRDMGWVVDLVPNHMSVAVPAQNPRWWDVLAAGMESPSARWFDIDWDAGAGRVVLPILGQPLDDEIEQGGISVARVSGDVVLDVRGTELPLAAGTVEGADVGAAPERVREIVHAQHHRPSFWRAGDRNYRVFFDIDALAGVRVEDEVVFEAVHARLADWVAADLVDGVRVDHVDGLVDPAGYLDRLRALIGPDRSLWVEKILLPEEDLPSTWPVEGTTGYDFARVATALAVDRGSQSVFDDAWRTMGGEADYEATEERAKRDALQTGLAPEVRRVAVEAATADPSLDPSAIEGGVVELAVGHPVYRTYGVGRAPLTPVDEGRLAQAVAHVVDRVPAHRDVVERLTTILHKPDSDEAARFRARFQQLTGPAMAKGAEDTAFYRYHRLVALSEVGGDPSTFGLPIGALHDRNLDAVAHWPSTMSAASTHDTKRSADVRARLAALTQHAARWRETLAMLRATSTPYRPDRLDGPTESLLWQTMIGAWPIGADRLLPYLEKAIRESGEHTTWTEPDESYEEAVASFGRAVLADDDVVDVVDRFVASIDPVGRAIRVGEIALRMASPGVPDTYQGDQDHDRSLVDPDNRRPVDHMSVDGRLVDAIEVGHVEAAGDLAKLWTTHRLLTLRSERPDDFGVAGSYSPVPVLGDHGRIVAFRRGDVVVVVDVHPGLGPFAGDVLVELPEGRWTDVLRSRSSVDGGSIAVRTLWADVPAAVLVPAPS